MGAKLYRLLKNSLPVVLLVLLSSFAIRPLLTAGFFNIHDFQHVARLFELDKSLLAGQFPVRWVADLGFGYGYNLFNFYPPFVYYLGEFFRLILNVGFLDSIKIVWAVALVGSAISMYFLAREFFGKVSGFVAAMFYLYAPYHAVDAYVRGALAELFSFVWLPLIMLFSYRAVRTGKISNVILAGIFLSLLMITHPLVFLPFFGLTLLWHFGLTFLHERKNFARSVLQFILSTVVCFSLSAFFWLPSIFEKQFTLTDAFLTQGLASYKIHFVCLSQLWNSPWGFGGSTAGCSDGVSFMLGKLYIFAAVFSFLALIFLHLKKKKVVNLQVAIIGSILLIVSIFMTTSYSKFIWDHVQQLWYLQFPWRFLEFTVLFSSLLAGFVVSLFLNKKVQIILAASAIGLLLVIEAKYFMPQQFFPNATDKTLLTEEQVKWVVSASSFEYMPKGLPIRILHDGGNMLDIDKSQINKSNHIVVTSGSLNFTKINFLPHEVSISGESRSGAELELPITYFPGWIAALDQKRIPIKSANRLKLITVNFPKGDHSLKVSFVNTSIRNIGNITSLIATLLLLLIFYGTRRNKK